jgi:subtilase family serine protease
MRSRTLTLAILPLTVAALALPPAAAAQPAHTAPAAIAAPSVQPNPDHIKTLTAVLQNMKQNYPTFARRTPGPQDIFDYNIGDLWLKGIDGTGTTVALIEGWDDPGIDAAIHTFDARYGLPDPTIQTIFPSGNGQLPAVCPPGMVALQSYGSCDAWVGELRLDVEAAHLIAPYAKILISATPADSEIVDDTPSQVAMPELMQALEFIGAHHLADAMSISDGTGESTYSNKAEINAQDPGLLSAAAAGIPVMVATGDCGVVQNLAVANAQCGNTTTTPDTAAWDDSPWVTAVGGSVPNFDVTGTRLGPDPVWHVAGIFSEGAGYSSVYLRPAYQDRVAAITGSAMRSVPDITMDAQQGTSEAAPLFAGVLALAAQLNHGPVGPINSALYQAVGPRGTQSGIADVVTGDDSVPAITGRAAVPGFTATAGFDVATGWGTIDASRFVPALVAATRDQEHNSPRQQAADALARLQHGIRLTQDDIKAGRSSYLFAGGFLPQHPVTLAVDGTTVATLTANTLGTVTYAVDPSVLTLSTGRHTLTLHSLLLNQTTTFRSD